VRKRFKQRSPDLRRQSASMSNLLPVNSGLGRGIGHRSACFRRVVDVGLSQQFPFHAHACLWNEATSTNSEADLKIKSCSQSRWYILNNSRQAFRRRNARKKNHPRQAQKQSLDQSYQLPWIAENYVSRVEPFTDSRRAWKSEEKDVFNALKADTLWLHCHRKSGPYIAQ
jgi:hypothetical protein